MPNPTDSQTVSPAQPPSEARVAEWKEVVARFQKPSLPRALWQIANTIVPYAALWYLMYRCLEVSALLVLPLAVLAGGFLVRIFIIFHDCGHGSFFKSRAANGIVGFIAGMLTFTPYYHWRWQHSLHHATSGDLDRRGTGDIWTMTVQEYIESSRWQRFAYRLARNPIVLFVLAPLFLFFFRHRFSSPKANWRERLSVWWMNFALLAMGASLSAVFGLEAYLLIQLLVLAVAGSAGVWLFYVQHQFEGVYWERAESWDFTDAALKGSSFYKLPRVLQWFSGNIGYHHIHHLSSRIPNYHLERCHNSHPLFQTVKPVTLLTSLKSFTFRLWDEQKRKLVGYRHAREVRRQQRAEQEAAGAAQREG
jgi:omega-6 fatty acid desaturase (delta-12 desaturase)